MEISLKLTIKMPDGNGETITSAQRAIDVLAAQLRAIMESENMSEDAELITETKVSYDTKKRKQTDGGLY